MPRFHIIACDVLRDELVQVAEQTDHEFTHLFLEQCLHNEPERLRAMVSEAVLAAPDYDAVLIGYGLCSNGLSGVRADGCPLVIPRAHDCITLFLGSRERYAAYFAENPGTYWYTPGWIRTSSLPCEERWVELRRGYAEQYGEENADYLMEMTHGSWTTNYKNAAYVDLGIEDNSEYVAFARRSAEYFGWKCDVLAGDPRLLAALVSGEWHEDDFLVVHPGQAVVASHDNRVLAVAR